MRILANQKTRHLFCWILLLITLSSSFSIVVVGLQWNGAVLYLFTSAICMGSLILTVLYLYFREQEQMIEHAVMQILESLSGNQNARIDCDDEGELYRLFHEINSLVAILNTHIENEKNTKYFLKDTISNISHQLKTPLTTLNIYNGLLQEEAQNSPAIQEFIHLSEQELDRIESLVQTLLKIAKLDSGTMVLEKTVENLSDMMDCIEQHFSYQAKQEKKQLILCRNDSVMLSCDRVWLISAILSKMPLTIPKLEIQFPLSGKHLLPSFKSQSKTTAVESTQKIFPIFSSDFIAAVFPRIHKGLGWGCLLSK